MIELMPYHCPHCDGELEHLDYSVDTSRAEFGYMNASDDGEPSHNWDHDGDDSDWNGDPMYCCGECGETIEGEQVNIFLRISAEENKFHIGDRIRVLWGEYHDREGIITRLGEGDNPSHHFVKLDNNQPNERMYLSKTCLRKISPAPEPKPSDAFLSD